MKTVKYIGQILASLVYTPIYIFILYCLVVFPFAWWISLSVKWMIVTFIFLSGAIEGLIFLVKFLGFLPFAWILDENKCAVWISAAICVLLPINYLYNAWVRLLELDTRGIIAAVIISLLMLHSVLMTISAMFSEYDK